MTLFATKNLTWRPPDADAPLLEAVDFEVAAGECVTLEGPSGSGKSTLLRCLIGLQEREAGRIEWRGEPVEGPAMRAFRRRVVYVHQEPVNIAGTVADNLAAARRLGATVDREDLLDEEGQRELLAELELSELSWQRDFDALSVGERQRVALVRCLTLQPDALLLDEPTASLDRPNARRIETHLIDYLEARPDERALVWVSHAPDLRERVATRVVDVREL